MDSLTHIVVGACIGDAIAGKQLGKKAMALGAFAQTIPDLDFITTFWLNDHQDIISHRGITHSVLFAVVATMMLAGMCRYIFRKVPVSWRTWFLLFGINLVAHLGLDSFNAYGIALLEPFSQKRYSLHILFVADPLFSVWPFLAFVALLLLKKSNPRRKAWRKMGLILPLCYLLFAVINKIIVQQHVRRNLPELGNSTEKYLITPTPFNSLLWFVTVTAQDGYYVGHCSVFDRPEKIDFTWFPKNDSLQNRVQNRAELKGMMNFADGFYTLENRNDTIVFSVLRFGQIVGWHDPHERFCFYYYFDLPGANEVVAQRGRFVRWNRETLRSMFRRIGGN